MIVRKLVTSIAFTLFLSATSQPGALAQGQNAYHEQIAAFTPKLEEARSAQAELNRTVLCLDRRDADLVLQRGKLESRLGQLRADMIELTPKTKALEDQYNSHKLEFEATQKEVTDLRVTIQNMPGRDRYERHKKDCASKIAADRMACGRRMGRDIFGTFEKIEGNLNAARRKEQIALDGMTAAKKNLDESAHQLATVKGQLTSAELEISRAENGIASVKRSLSALRDLIQPLRIAVDQFMRALNEAKGVSLADERPRTLRTLADIATQVAAAMARGRDAVANVDKALGAGWTNNCKAN